MASPVAARRLPAALLLALLAGCGGGGSTAPTPAATPDSNERQVASVVDGDTIRLSSAAHGATSVRFLNVDAPERGGDTQEPWATEATGELQGLLPAGTTVRLETAATVLDSYGRLLAHVKRTSDGLDVNREQLRRGRVVLYVLWPNVAHFDEYRAAQVSARREGLGVWSPGHPLSELPFAYRQRGETSTRPVGDWLTRYYVAAAGLEAVPVSNRVFFSNAAEAEGAGFRPCPQDASGYLPTCFGPAD